MRSLALLFLVAAVSGAAASVFSIEEYGAVSGVETVGQALTNGQALRSAIEAADAQGPGSVALVPAGVFWMLPTPPFEGVDGVTLQIDGTLSALVDLKSWPNDTSGNALDFMSFADSSNLRITGQGAVRGNGYSYWWQVILTGHDNRPNLLWMETCKNVELDSLLFENSPQYHIYLHDVANVFVHDLTVYVDVEGQRDMLDSIGKLTGPGDPLGRPAGLPTFPLNTDGIDPSGFNITITNVNITCFDDAVAVKPCNGNCKLSNCSSNITVSNAYIKYGVGMTIGSVPPNDAVNCVQHVVFRDIYFDRPLKAVYVKTNPGEHGTGIIDDIVYENMYAKQPLYWAVYIGPQQQSQPGNGTHTGCSFLYPLPHTQCPTQPRVPITNVVLRNVTIEDALLSVGMIRCNETKPCTGFVFDGVHANSVLKWPVGPGYLCENVSGTSTDSDPVPDCLTPTRTRAVDQDTLSIS